jgi:hypothetical protein
VDEGDLARVTNGCSFLARDVNESLRSVDVCRAREAAAEQLVMDDADATANV